VAALGPGDGIDALVVFPLNGDLTVKECRRDHCLGNIVKCLRLFLCSHLRFDHRLVERKHPEIEQCQAQSGATPL
jgi:hypothetical protein